MNTGEKNMRKSSGFPKTIFLLGLTLFLFAPFLRSYANDEDLFKNTPLPPNVLVILDNSNSMDEDFYANAVGSYSPSSKSVNARKILIDMVNKNVNKMRIGLMTYKLPNDVVKTWLHNNHFFVSFQLKSYCPNPPPECVDYCRTGNAAKKSICQTTCKTQNSYFDASYMPDEIISNFNYPPVGSEKRDRYCKLIYPKTKKYYDSNGPGDIYYTYPSTLHIPHSVGDYVYHGFLDAPSYSTADFEGGYYYTGVNYYDLWTSKWTNWDDYKDHYGYEYPYGYSEFLYNAPWVPVDSSFAEGFRNFGKRNAFYYVGQAWESETCPGNGFLQVPVTDNDSSNSHLNALLNKLATKENNESGYMSCWSSDMNNCSYVINAGITPTPGTLQTAADYFTGSQSPIQYSCQKNFVVYATDGLPSADESGKFNTADALMPSVVTKLNNLRNLTKSGTSYDVKTYIVGMGLKAEHKAKLDQMAVAGGTAMDGHAYYADNQSQLQESLSKVFANITEGVYSFGQASVAANRVSGEDYIIEASFEPATDDPFWRGHLKKYSINSDGTIGSAVWDAGSLLQAKASADRKIFSYTGGSMGILTDAAPGIDKKYLGVDTNWGKAIVAYIRGDIGPSPDNWKLGDLFHSNPITVGSPSAYFTDVRSPEAFINFRNSHKTRNKIVLAGANDGQFHAFNASDGGEQWSFIPPNLLPKLQYIAHCHSGVSGCSNLPDKSSLSHTYFVDGPMTAADVWLGTGDGKSKSADGSEWRTLLVFGEGKGVRDQTNDATKTNYLWSSQPDCSSQNPGSDFNKTYSSTYKYYCGYYALDVTDTSAGSPVYKWPYGRLNLTDPDNQGPYLGEPWSRMAIGKVVIKGTEKWVGFIGGGYSTGTNSGKGFFVVDLSNGNILWSYTKANNSSMTYSIPASPAVVDSDNDGFIDAAYVGDSGGNMWRFTFCKQADGSTCDISPKWRGGLLFQASSARPIYTSATVARDSSSLWVFWGTGDKENPTNTTEQNSFFAVKDNDRSTTYTVANLQDISTEGTTYNGTSSGWYITLPGAGEKVVSDPTAFGGMVLFTTYSPSGDACANLGEGRLYALSMMPLRIGGILYNPGAGLMSAPSNSTSTGGGARSVSLGVGVPSGPFISQNPVKNKPTDLFVSVSGAGGVNTQIVSESAKLPNTPLTDRLKDTAPSSEIVHWRDGRIQ